MSLFTSHGQNSRVWGLECIEALPQKKDVATSYLTVFICLSIFFFLITYISCSYFFLYFIYIFTLRQNFQVYHFFKSTWQLIIQLATHFESFPLLHCTDVAYNTVMQMFRHNVLWVN